MSEAAEGGATSSSEAIGAFVEVAIGVPLRTRFTYSVPISLRSTMAVGARVAVPFGRTKKIGFVVAFAQTAPEGLKRVLPVASVLDPIPVFPTELMQFLLRAAQYYVHPLGEVLQAAAPPMERIRLKHLRDTGFLTDDESFGGTTIASRLTWRIRRIEASADGVRLGARQLQLLGAITAAPDGLWLDELRAIAKSPRAAVQSLADKGLVAIEEVRAPSNEFFASSVVRDVPPTLNAAQLHATTTIQSAVAKREGGAALLFGVTGSGKTEVYLHAIEHALSLGQGALVLVPEIALTPQLVSSFRARFGDEIAVLHSALTAQERYEAWTRLRSGSLRIAVGARSALFAPVRELGLIVVDEEHDSSFKQEEGFRYHARDMALLRAQMNRAVCVLGSATPSLEMFEKATKNEFALLELPTRATGQQMPTAEVVDLRRHRGGPTGVRLFSAPLHKALGETLERGEQAIIFLNRRGFASTLSCTECGAIATCPACSVGLTYHRGVSLLVCHYCDYRRDAGLPCTECGATEHEHGSLGTEQLQEAIAKAFPGAKIGRLDRDTASGRSVEGVIDQLRTGAIDVLVGTQMVTKGHDIARVTLVGVILADQSLGFPDFRAQERTFQLLEQVAGRAGRGDRPGRVIVQAFQPEHPAIHCALQHDYRAFFESELKHRRDAEYPPFARLVALRVSAVAHDDGKRVAEQLAALARAHEHVRRGSVVVLGPTPAPIERLRGRYRFRVLLKSAQLRALRDVVSVFARAIDGGVAPARASIDVDPVWML